MNRLFTYLIMIVILSVFVSCLDTQTLNAELDTTESIEAYQGSNRFNAALLESSDFPCIQSDNCKPTTITDAFMSVQVNSENGKQIKYNGSSYSNQEILTAPQDVVTLTVTTATKTYSATSVSPDSTKVIVASTYQLGGANPGLFFLVDTNALNGIHGLFIQFFANGKLSEYGFLITSDKEFSNQLPNNGFYIGFDQFYISHDEILRSIPETPLFKGDDYVIIVRNISLESLEFYSEFKRILREGNVNLNNGLFFAPPEHLPTNFDNGAFGFFHLFHERLITDVVQ